MRATKRCLWTSLFSTVICWILLSSVAIYQVIERHTNARTSNRYDTEGTASKFTHRRNPAFQRTASTSNESVLKSTHLPLPDDPNIDIAGLSTDDMTVVTAYFDIGEFQKGIGGSVWSSSLYRQWMMVFAHISNPVVAYFDRAEHADLMRMIRHRQPQNRTRVVIVDRSSLIAFSRFRPRIEAIFRQPAYPYNPPNTVDAAYSAAMHAKYELTLRTIVENPFQTAYFCWLDVGLFRDLTPSSSRWDQLVKAFGLFSDDDPDEVDGASVTPPILLWLPPGFDESRVAYTEVIHYGKQRSGKNSELSTAEIVTMNYVWVCGCFFVGRADRLATWSVEYLAGVERMLDTGWISTDQQVILWMFYGDFDGKLTTKIQGYLSNGRYNDWFYLGYLAKEVGDVMQKHQARRANLTGGIF